MNVVATLTIRRAFRDTLMQLHINIIMQQSVRMIPVIVLPLLFYLFAYIRLVMFLNNDSIRNSNTNTNETNSDVSTDVSRRHPYISLSIDLHVLRVDFN